MPQAAIWKNLTVHDSRAYKTIAKELKDRMPIKNRGGEEAHKNHKEKNNHHVIITDI
jgi:hypothetical protein